MSGKTIEQVQQEHADKWMAIPGVVGVAISTHEGKPCIAIFAAAPAEQIRKQVPSTVEGYTVVIQHTGEFRALDEP